MDEVNYAEFQLNSGIIDKNTYYDKLTLLVIARVLQSTSVCIDIGAHTGSILRLMIKYAPNGQFYVFEPIPYLYKALVQAFKEDNIHVYNLALSDSAGNSSFNYVISNPAYSGLIKRRYDFPHEVDTQIIVKTELLDTILASEKADKVSFIKIDVEGAEYLVIKGAQERIKKDKPIIVFEHGLGASDYYGKGPEDLYHLLYDICGLRVSLLQQWLLREKTLNLDTFCDQYYNGKNYYFIAHE